MPVLGQLHHIGWLFRVNRNEVGLLFIIYRVAILSKIITSYLLLSNN